MNIINKKIKFSEIKNFFKKKGFILIKKKTSNHSKNSDMNVLLRTALSSLIVISLKLLDKLFKLLEIN